MLCIKRGFRLPRSDGQEYPNSVCTHSGTLALELLSVFAAAKDLIQDMLNPDFSTRIALRLVVSHPWLLSVGSGSKSTLPDGTLVSPLIHPRAM